MTVGQKMILPLKIKNSQILPTGYTVMRVLPEKGRGQGLGGEGDDDMSFTSLASEDKVNEGRGSPLASSSAAAGGVGGGGQGGDVAGVAVTVTDDTAADEHKAMEHPSGQGLGQGQGQGQGLEPATENDASASGVSAGKGQVNNTPTNTPSYIFSNTPSNIL